MTPNGAGFFVVFVCVCFFSGIEEALEEGVE